MSRPWFRLYHEFVSDPKVQLLAFEDQRHFIAILCLKCNDTLDSKVASSELRERMIAKALGLDPMTSKEVKRRLMEAGLINQDWHPKQWDSRQFESDNSSSRTAAYRQRLMNKSRCDGDVTSQERQCDALDQIQNRTDKDTDQNPSAGAEVQKVFEHWQKTWNHPKAKLDAKRVRIIKAGLKSYSLEKLCSALSGYRKSKFHVENSQDEITLHLRDSAHIEKGLQLAEKQEEQKWM